MSFVRRAVLPTVLGAACRDHPDADDVRRGELTAAAPREGVEAWLERRRDSLSDLTIMAQTDMAEASWRAIGTITALETLQLKGPMAVPEVGWRAISSNLKKLYVYRVGLSDSAMASIGRLSKLETLEILHVEGHEPEAEWIRDLSGLRQLRLAGSGIRDRVLLHVGDLSRLEHLGLNKTEITDAGLEALERLSNLRSVFLDGTAVSGRGLRHLRFNKELAHVHLERAPVTDAGLSGVRELTSLRTLHLTGTRVTDRGFAHLESLTNFQELSLPKGARGPGLRHLHGLEKLLVLRLEAAPDRTALAALRAALPLCTIYDS